MVFCFNCDRGIVSVNNGEFGVSLEAQSGQILINKNNLCSRCQLDATFPVQRCSFTPP